MRVGLSTIGSRNWLCQQWSGIQCFQTRGMPRPNERHSRTATRTDSSGGIPKYAAAKSIWFPPALHLKHLNAFFAGETAKILLVSELEL